MPFQITAYAFPMFNNFSNIGPEFFPAGKMRSWRVAGRLRKVWRFRRKRLPSQFHRNWHTENIAKTFTIIIRKGLLSDFSIL